LEKLQLAGVLLYEEIEHTITVDVDELRSGMLETP